MIMSNELKPCPICESDKISKSPERGFEGYCRDCGFRANQWNDIPRIPHAELLKLALDRAQEVGQ